MSEFRTIEMVRSARLALLKREGGLAATLLAHYQRTARRLEKQLHLLEREYRDAIANQEHYLQFFSRLRVIAILEQVRKLIDDTGEKNTKITSAAQAKNIVQALKDYEKIIALSGEFHRLPVEAVEVMAGHLADGTPLSTYFQQFGPEAKKQAEDILLRGITMGTSTKTIATELRGALNLSSWRSIATARAETMRTYRQTAIELMAYNSMVVTGWMWVAHMSSRTCAACLGLHGSIHPLTEVFGSHTSCRCVPAPVMGEAPEVQSGEDWLREQSSGVQDSVLGKAKGNLYRQNKFVVSDLVDRHMTKWGPTARVRSLNDLVGQGIITQSESNKALLATK